MRTLIRTVSVVAVMSVSSFADSKVDVFALAGAAYDSGKFEKAATLYKDAGRRGQQPAIAWFNYGNCQARLGKRGDAAAAWRKAIEWAPRFKRARLNLAILSEEDGQVGAAVTEYRRLWELDQTDATVAIRLGELLLTQSEPVGAVDWFEKALLADSSSAGAYEGMVRAQLQSQDTLSARFTLERWSEFAPDTSGRIWLVKSSLWEQAGDLEQARLACETALSYSPENGESWLRLARIEQLAGAEATAVSVLLAATTRLPKQGKLWKALGQSALRAGDGETAYLGLSEAIARGESGAAELARILSSWHQARGEQTLAGRAKDLWKSAKK